MSDVSDTLDQLMNLLEGNSSLQHPVYSLLIDDTLAPTLDCVQPPLQHQVSQGEKRKRRAISPDRTRDEILDLNNYLLGAYDKIHKLHLSHTHLREGTLNFF